MVLIIVTGSIHNLLLWYIMINKKRPLLIQGLNPAWYSHHHTKKKKPQTTISITEITENIVTKTKKRPAALHLCLSTFLLGPVHLPN